MNVLYQYRIQNGARQSFFDPITWKDPQIDSKAGELIKIEVKTFLGIQYQYLIPICVWKIKNKQQ